MTDHETKIIIGSLLGYWINNFWKNDKKLKMR